MATRNPTRRYLPPEQYNLAKISAELQRLDIRKVPDQMLVSVMAAAARQQMFISENARVTIRTCEEFSLQEVSGKKDGVHGTHVRVALNAESVLFISDAERRERSEQWMRGVVEHASAQLLARVHAASSKESAEAEAIRNFV